MSEISNENKIGLAIGLFLLSCIIIFLVIPISYQDDTYFIESGSGGNGTGCTDLDCLTDVLILDVENNNILQYNSTISQWENRNTMYNVTIRMFDRAIYFSENINNNYSVSNEGNILVLTQNIADTGSSFYIVGNNSYAELALVGNGNVLDLYSTPTGFEIDINGNVYTFPANSGRLLTNVNLLEGVGIDITEVGDDLTISNTSPESTVCTNAGSASSLSEGLCINNLITLKRLLEGTGILLSSNSTHITLTNSSPESTICTNLGTVGEGIYVSGNCDFKKLLAGNGITLSANGTRITITNSLPESTVCNNLGTGNQLCSGGNVNIDTLIAGTGITISDTTDDYTFSSQCANTGTGEAVCESSNNINSLIAGTGISITDTTGDLTITSTIVGERNIGQQAGDVYASLTKTNIGNAYVDIYVSAFDEENMLIVDCANVTYGRVSYIWDYVGTGTQQLRWVNVANNTEVFYESPTFTTDRDATDSGYFVKPSWCTTIVSLEQQGKSTVAGDDPVAKGYVITIK